MATRAESLIRQFAEARIKDIGDVELLAAKHVPQRVRVTSLPQAVQRALKNYRKYSALKDRAKRALVALDIEPYNLTHGSQVILNPYRNKRQAEINDRRIARQTQVRTLREAAYIQVMGAKPAEARAVVEQFQQAIAKI